jgi:hypothetical protein
MHPMIPLLREVEESGLERAITVISAHGVTSGTLVPLARYRRWYNDIYRKAVADGVPTPRSTFRPSTESEREEFRWEWEARLAAARAAQGFPGDDEELSGLFDAFCLENARDGSERFEYSLVSTRSVTAFHLGQPSHRDGGA